MNDHTQKDSNSHSFSVLYALELCVEDSSCNTELYDGDKPEISSILQESTCTAEWQKVLVKLYGDRGGNTMSPLTLEPKESVRLFSKTLHPDIASFLNAVIVPSLESAGCDEVMTAVSLAYYGLYGVRNPKDPLRDTEFCKLICKYDFLRVNNTTSYLFAIFHDTDKTSVALAETLEDSSLTTIYSVYVNTLGKSPNDIDNTVAFTKASTELERSILAAVGKLYIKWLCVSRGVYAETSMEVS